MHAIQVRLEAHYRDMLDLEFTIEQGRLFMLQTRVGKRTARSAIRIAYDLVQEGVIDKTEAILRIPAHRFEEASRPDLKDPAKLKSRTLARGIAASPGVVSGYPVFTAAEAVARKNEAVILVRPETSPDDIAGMAVAVGILTQRGGATSHAAVVARGMGKTCVAGCDGIEVDTGHHVIRIGDRIISGEDLITLDGARGILIEGAVETVPPKLGKDFYEVLRWAEELSSIKVRANADTPEDARVARELGAEGIGLCRTEHMFFGEDRILAVQEMILANTPESRQKALDLLLPMQREDFEGIFEAMEGLPVTIRLLDPPLHEFLPHTTEDIRPLMPRLGLSMEVLKARVARLEEANPMLGHRGCRLALTYPEIAVMQTQAIISAACAVVKSGKTVLPEIMIPLVAFARELEILRALVVKTADATLVEEGVTLNYMVGTMIELPRAALTADEVAEHAEFFSFGTNDLTQTTLGLSRDDSGRFLQTYLDQGIMLADPFATMDDAVAGLVAQAVKKGRQTRPGMKMGICGEHGGDPDSVAKCVAMGLDYVSCSPYRVPVARMAAAHAALAG
jgi:pyruvate,orthophosphate dikinase